VPAPDGIPGTEVLSAMAFGGASIPAQARTFDAETGIWEEAPSRFSYQSADETYDKVEAARILMSDEMKRALGDLAVHMSVQEAAMWNHKIQEGLARLGPGASRSEEEEGASRQGNSRGDVRESPWPSARAARDFFRRCRLRRHRERSPVTRNRVVKLFSVSQGVQSILQCGEQQAYSDRVHWPLRLQPPAILQVRLLATCRVAISPSIIRTTICRPRDPHQ
jgi:hypothetical protein